MLLRISLFLSILVSAQSSPLFYQMAYDYVGVCCFTLDGDQFEKMIADDVLLWHQTNDGEVLQAKGKEEITNLFRKYIFSNSSEIDVKKCSFEETDGGIRIDLLVEENKANEGRYLFQERTMLHFSGSKISSIEMHVIKR
ncbi:MAG TPA: hypothetical protein VLG44_06870 [Chlamydiales bacterium]|nr:hypothetical protein [Chlamydiales bacterium]